MLGAPLSLTSFQAGSDKSFSAARPKEESGWVVCGCGWVCFRPLNQIRSISEPRTTMSNFGRASRSSLAFVSSPFPQQWANTRAAISVHGFERIFSCKAGIESSHTWHIGKVVLAAWFKSSILLYHTGPLCSPTLLDACPSSISSSTRPSLDTCPSILFALYTILPTEASQEPIQRPDCQIANREETKTR